MVRRFFILSILLATGNAAAQDPPPHVFGSGGLASENGSIRLYSTVGEVAAADGGRGIFGGSGSQQGVGFWFVLREGFVVAVEDLPAPPLQNWLGQNHPNPFNPATNIDFSIVKDGPVRLQLFNVRGELVADLIDGSLPAGKHTLVLRPTELSSGVYFYHLQSDGYEATRRLLLLK